MSDHLSEPAPLRPGIDASAAPPSSGDPRIDDILREAGLDAPVDAGVPLDPAQLEDLAERGERVRDRLQRRLADLDGT